MTIRCIYFALLRERLGRSEETLELPDGATAAFALSLLASRHEAIAGLKRSLLLAVNQTLVPGDFPLSHGDEVALMPPVSGGAGSEPRCRISREALQVESVLDAVRGPGQGGVVLFCGLVRDSNQGKQVVRLDYEAYDTMALRSMAAIAHDIESETAGVRLAMVHRVGSLGIGELAVLVAASAPHRAEAFAACRQAIERLKAEVPIWKKEFSPDGAEWLGGAG